MAEAHRSDAIRSILEQYQYAFGDLLDYDRTRDVAIARRTEDQLVEAVEAWCVAKAGRFAVTDMHGLEVVAVDAYYAAQDDIRGDGRGEVYIAIFEVMEAK